MESAWMLNDKHYTYKDYKNWAEGERLEIINGVVHNMSPSPSRQHQKIVVELLRHFSNFLKGKPCEVYTAPFDVILPKGEEIDDDIDIVVQPDLLVVCDLIKLSDICVKGAPDLVIEVLSPSTGGKDKVEKLNLYEYSGVKEYWILDPEDNTLMSFKLGKDGKYGRPETYSQEHKVGVGIFSGELIIDLATVFK